MVSVIDMSMSQSGRLSTSSCSMREELINACEAEEERIVNILSRRLERLREERILLERTHEEESQSHVNRLARQLTTLRVQSSTNTGEITNSSECGDTATNTVTTPCYVASSSSGAFEPNIEVPVTALMEENESLRTKLMSMENDYAELKKINELCRVTLLEYQRRLGLDVDSVTGSAVDTQVHGKDKQEPVVLNREEGWDEQTSPYGVVLDFVTQAEVQRRVAFTAKMVTLKPAPNNDFFFQKIFGDDTFIAAGQLVIPVGGKKPSKGTRDNSYVFYLIEGAINLKIYRSSYIIATGGMFMIPRGNHYYIENISQRPAKLFFTQARKLMMNEEINTVVDTRARVIT